MLRFIDVGEDLASCTCSRARESMLACPASLTLSGPLGQGFGTSPPKPRPTDSPPRSTAGISHRTSTPSLAHSLPPTGRSIEMAARRPVLGNNPARVADPPMATAEDSSRQDAPAQPEQGAASHLGPYNLRGLLSELESVLQVRSAITCRVRRVCCSETDDVALGGEARKARAGGAPIEHRRHGPHLGRPPRALRRQHQTRHRLVR